VLWNIPRQNQYKYFFLPWFLFNNNRALLNYYSVATTFFSLFRRVKKQVCSETILIIAYIHVTNNKTDFLPKFESLKWFYSNYWIVATPYSWRSDWATKISLRYSILITYFKRHFHRWFQNLWLMSVKFLW
jgi:hypothetical protein